MPLDTIDRYVAGQREVRDLVIADGRDDSSIDFAYWAIWPWTGEMETATDGTRRLLTGSAQALIDDVRRLEDAGVSHLSIMVVSDGVEGTVKNIKRFADEVMARA